MDNYQQNGYLVLRDFVSQEDCTALIKQANNLIEQFNPEETSVIFSTKDNRHANNNYFLESADKIRFFLEENALDQHGKLTTDKLLSINKIGHALHDIDPVFNRFSRTPKLAALVNQLGVEQPKLIQSMYLCKQPFIGAEVTAHQDNTYIYMKEQPVTGLWFALEDATIENGCLWAIPGGHQNPLKSRMIRDNNNSISTEIYDETPWELEKMIPLEVPRGSLVVIHGLLPHMSKENSSSRSRHAYSIHLVSGKYEYANNNWLQRSDTLPFSGFERC